jgi:4-amino-4-deoxy-L-arabinose transferase-like glycosyltransferase
VRDRLILIAAVLLIRLPFLNHPVQGDDAYYLAIAQHAQINPLHPTHFEHISAGITVDMRGYPHPPLNGWYLGLLLALLGDVREVAFHVAYLPFSLVAALAAYSIARRLCAQPLWAALLLVVSPPFVINGTSLESDLPHLAFFLLSIALFLGGRLLPAALAMALAALTSYQAILLTPVLGAVLLSRRSRHAAEWAAVLAPAATIAAYQLWERYATGALPAAVLGGYMQSYGLQSLVNKARNAAALTTHLGWLVSPLLAPWNWWMIPVAAVAAWWTPSPLFWLPFSLGVATLLAARRNAWTLIFFAGALVIFFAGSARYLLPLVLPVTMLAVARHAARPRLLAAAASTQLALSLALATANEQHWSGYRQFVADHAAQIAARRTWINGEWGLRFYAESLGGLPYQRGISVYPGELVVASRLGFPMEVTTGGGTLSLIEQRAIQPALPLRLLDLDSCSAYSSNQRGLCAFGWSRTPADEVALYTVVERAPELSFLPMDAPAAAWQIVSGIYALEGGAWRWASARSVVLLKPPERPLPLTATFRIVEQSPARHIRLSMNGVLVAEATFPGPGLYTLRAEPALPAGGKPVSVTLAADRSFRAPGDNRDLALIVTAVGFAAP